MAQACRCTVRWAVDISEWQPNDSEWSRLLALIPSHEQADVTRFVRQEDRKRALVSRLAQRACASTTLGLPYASISLARTKGKRPFVTNQVHKPQAPNFNFNAR